MKLDIHSGWQNRAEGMGKEYSSLLRFSEYSWPLNNSGVKGTNPMQ